MVGPLDSLRPALAEPAASWLGECLDRVRREGHSAVAELLPQLPRRVGRQPLGGGTWERGDAVVDLGAWRRCDAAAWALLDRQDAPAALEVELFAHGDLEERTMLLRSASAWPVREATIALLNEAQRTNAVSHFEAAVCDSNLAVRAAADARFGTAGFNRLLLKLAFLDLPLSRVLGAERRANPELSRMLQGLATEREAAGRAVWADTNRLIALAPTEGTVARLVGHLEHGDDRQRLAAAEGIAALRRRDLARFAAERLGREPRAEIRAALQRALSIDDSGT